MIRLTESLITNKTFSGLFSFMAMNCRFYIVVNIHERCDIVSLGFSIILISGTLLLGIMILNMEHNQSAYGVNATEFLLYSSGYLNDSMEFSMSTMDLVSLATIVTQLLELPE